MAENRRKEAPEIDGNEEEKEENKKVKKKEPPDKENWKLHEMKGEGNLLKGNLRTRVKWKQKRKKEIRMETIKKRPPDKLEKEEQLQADRQPEKNLRNTEQLETEIRLRKGKEGRKVDYLALENVVKKPGALIGTSNMAEAFPGYERSEGVGKLYSETRKRIFRKLEEMIQMFMKWLGKTREQVMVMILSKPSKSPPYPETDANISGINESYMLRRGLRLHPMDGAIWDTV
jgi:hypothetical protein